MIKLGLSIVFLSIILIGYFSSGLNKPAESKSSLDLHPMQNESTEAFDKMMQVLMHQRCINCHPAEDKPTEGKDNHESRLRRDC